MNRHMSRRKISLHLKILTWINICAQVSFPLAVAFTPTIASAGNDGHFLLREVQTDLQTQVYTLKDGESVASVANEYNISLESLRKLNQFRTFARGFDLLQAGDELDVPVAPLPEVRWDDAPATSVSSQSNENVQAQKAAGFASQAGNFLASGAHGEAAASLARGMVTGAAGSEIQQWLSGIGTARVQLDADKNFSFKNSQLDLLVPLYEQKDSLVFTQGSVHRTDERSQSNLGLGYRWFAGDWMLGANTFLDYDLSRDHARLGLGGEYWRDFLKLGMNTYYRLTGWKNSPDLEDYEERPANGWDVRAQYWLPALPQLGGKLTYEQYYGDEVALFGRDNRQRNPHVITAGVNYTPIPLLTFSAEQHQGQSGKSDTRLGVDMNYQLGMPWQHQINPDAVAAMRSLAGSRYDLVDRNNNIVLEYRKKEVIHLKTADLVTGYAGEQKSLGVSVNSKYGLERIDWSASPLISAGGKIVQNGGDFAVVMPEYRSYVNNYTVTGVAVDKKGNISNQAEIQVTVQAPQVSSTQSTFTPAASMLPADGKSTQALTLSVKDANGQPVNIAVSDVEMRPENQADATLSSLESQGDGVMVVTVTAGVQPAVLSLTPVVQGVSLPAAKVVISDSAPDAGRSSFSASPDTIPADNTTTSLLTVSLMNKEGLPVAGVKDSLALTLTPENGRARSSAPVTLSDITEEQAGRYTATLKGSHAGVYTAIPQYNGAPLGSLSATVTLKAGGAVQANSSITRDSDSYESGDDMTLTVTLKDASSTPNPVTGLSSAALNAMVAAANAEAKSGANWTETAAGSGVYTGLFVAQAAGTGLKATLTLADGRNDSAPYAITAGGAVQANSSITRDSDSYESGDDMTLTVTLKDASSTPNPVTGLSSDTLAGMVSVANAEAKSGTAWAETAAGSGVYTGVYVARAVGTGLAATLTVRDGSKTSEAYAITAEDEAPASINTHVNPYSFTQTSEEGTFPTTGFTGATFTIVPKDNKSATDYTWAANASWVSVTDGVVTFTGKGVRDKVTVTGTPSSGQGKIIKYSFTLKSWFIHNGSTQAEWWSVANAYCSSQSGYSLATLAQLTNDQWRGFGGEGPYRATNEALWSEWGDILRYEGAGFPGRSYWSSDEKYGSSSSSHYYVGMNWGGVSYIADGASHYVMCRQSL